MDRLDVKALVDRLESVDLADLPDPADLLGLPVLREPVVRIRVKSVQSNENAALIGSPLISWMTVARFAVAVPRLSLTSEPRAVSFFV